MDRGGCSQMRSSAQSILQREGMRQLPGICRYSAKCTDRTVNQGGTAGDLEFDARPWQNQILPETGVF